MGKYRIYAGISFLICICLCAMGCRREEGALHPLLINKIECRLCGDGKDSFRSIYGRCQGVGLFCLNDQRMIEIQPCAEEMGDGGVSYVWADAYSVRVEEIKDRGIALVRYTADKNDTLDEEGLSEVLCPACVEKVKESVRIYGKHKGRKEKAVCLVDLSTMRPYGIQQSFQYYMFDDYYVQASCQGDEIQLTVFRTSSADLAMH